MEIRRPDGCTVYYEVHGQGPQTAIMVQGLGASMRFWHGLPQALAEADPQRKIIALDNRGSGRSRPNRRLWTISDFADDMVAVLDAEGIPAAFVVGNSLGGMVAQRFVARHPQRARALLLISTMPALYLARLPSLRTIRNVWNVATCRHDQVPDALIELLLTKEVVGERGRQMLRAFPDLMTHESPRTFWTFLRQALVVATHLTPPKAIRCPTLIIAGANDQMVSPRNAKALAKHIPGARIRLLANIGHSLPVMAPERIVEAFAELEQMDPIKA